jgi:signal transduction histidine kinase
VPIDPAAFGRLVLLGCHDLRTPLAAVNGFSKTLLRGSDLQGQDQRFVGVIAEAAEQMADLLDLLAVAARIESGRYDAVTSEVSTLTLVDNDDELIGVEGTGATVEADAAMLRRALHALAVGALRHGPVERVTWKVDGHRLELSPVTEAAAPVLLGEKEAEFGALVARLAIEQAGGMLVLDGEVLRVVLESRAAA